MPTVRPTVTIRFHFDEHVPSAVASQLRRAGVDLTRPGDVGLLGAADEEHLNFATAEGRVLVTGDTDFLQLHNLQLRAGPATHPGIVYWTRRNMVIGSMVASLTLIWQIYESHDLHGRIEYIP